MKEIGGFQFNNVLSSKFLKLCLDLLALAKLNSVVNTGQYSKVMNTNGRDEDRPGKQCFDASNDRYHPAPLATSWAVMTINLT